MWVFCDYIIVIIKVIVCNVRDKARIGLKCRSSADQDDLFTKNKAEAEHQM